MAKIKINDKDLYTDDFNESQMQIYNELQINATEISRLEYVVNVLKNRQSFLVTALEQEEENKSAEEEVVDDAD
jgi:hypothetical protein